jgi:cyclopropane fatty-acyl-phospholipid synthase-like methyltransferase
LDVARLAFRRAPSEYDDVFVGTMARMYVEQTPWTRLRLRALKCAVEPAAGDRILDLGCAAGALTHFFSEFGAQVTGLDASPNAIAKARELFPGLEFVEADVSDLRLPAHSFDKAVAGDFVEHLDDETLRAMLMQLTHVLIPDGTFTLYTPNPKHLIERLKAHDFLLAQNPTHIGLRTASELRSILSESGLIIDRDTWAPSSFPVLRSIERPLGRHTDLLRYRLVMRARTPAS